MISTLMIQRGTSKTKKSVSSNNINGDKEEIDDEKSIFEGDITEDPENDYEGELEDSSQSWY